MATSEDSLCCLRTNDLECSETPLLTFNDLNEEQHLQLLHIMPAADYFCMRHLSKQIHLFEYNERTCADPLHRHKKPIKLNLVVVNLEMHLKFQPKIFLVPGQKLCRNCATTHIPDWYKEKSSPVSSQITTSSSSEVYCSPGFVSSQNEIQEAKAVIDEILNMLSLPPIDPSKRNSKVSIAHKFFLVFHCYEFTEVFDITAIFKRETCPYCGKYPKEV